ncbi:MAG: D-aminoacyl-tRNA deacylase [Gammaproteobacteria bacterium]|nr:D-aminoacyl-tRNA deacylase [Gammaproteobacteria bacterium]
MVGLLQRVLDARVIVDGKTMGEIGQGLAVLVGIERNDNEQKADRLLDRLLGYRVFADETGRMNLSLHQTRGGLLLIPNFTLVADTQKGMRASFSPAATPGDGQRLFDYLDGLARMRHPRVQSGDFGAHMQVALTNDGPVTFWLRVP